MFLNAQETLAILALATSWLVPRLIMLGLLYLVVRKAVADALSSHDADHQQQE